MSLVDYDDNPLLLEKICSDGLINHKNTFNSFFLHLSEIGSPFYPTMFSSYFWIIPCLTRYVISMESTPGSLPSWMHPKKLQGGGHPGPLWSKAPHRALYQHKGAASPHLTSEDKPFITFPASHFAHFDLVGCFVRQTRAAGCGAHGVIYVTSIARPVEVPLSMKQTCLLLWGLLAEIRRQMQEAATWATWPVT